MLDKPPLTKQKEQRPGPRQHHRNKENLPHTPQKVIIHKHILNLLGTWWVVVGWGVGWEEIREEEQDGRLELEQVVVEGGWDGDV